MAATSPFRANFYRFIAVIIFICYVVYSTNAEPVLANTLNANNSQFQNDEQISDIIAYKVLDFALKVGNQLNRNSEYSSHGRSEIFSPISIMSALSLLMLGAKHRTYQQLHELFDLDRPHEFVENPEKFYQQFVYMLADLQHMTGDLPINGGRYRQAPWRKTEPRYKLTPADIRRLPESNTVKQKCLESLGCNVSVEPMQFTKKQPNYYEFSMANGIFIDEEFKLNPDYMQVVTSIHQVQFADLAFRRAPKSARNYINAWVDQRSFGKIRNIISEEMISSCLNMLLIAVVYFKGFWEVSFFPRATREENFYLDGIYNAPVRVPMMSTGGLFPFYDAKEYDCRIIGLPYRGNEVTMYVIQPYNSSRQKLQQLQQILDADKINYMIARMVLKSTVMVFPKMHFLHSIDLKTVLTNLGVSDLFQNGVSDLSLIENTRTKECDASCPCMESYEPHNLTVMANIGLQRYETISKGLKILEKCRQDFSNTRSNLFVDQILHKVDLTIHEQGTEAAAATLTYLRRSGSDVVFRGDTPFLLLIQHDPTKLPLFYGIINRPMI